MIVGLGSWSGALRKNKFLATPMVGRPSWDQLNESVSAKKF
jgi:hypothetical protein